MRVKADVQRVPSDAHLRLVHERGKSIVVFWKNSSSSVQLQSSYSGLGETDTFCIGEKSRIYGTGFLVLVVGDVGGLFLIYNRF